MPAASLALTLKVWEPLAKPVYVLGEEHALKAPLSREHSKEEPASEEEKVNVASLLLAFPEGPESMVVCGGVVSGGGGVVPAAVVKDQLLSEASGLPARSLTPLVPPFTVAV